MPASEAEPITKLLRFLYLGTSHCQYNSKDKTNLPPIIRVELNCINSMAEGAYNLPLTVITRFLTNESQINRKNALLALAFCMRCVNSENGEKLRSESYKEFSKLIKTDEDFMLLLHFYKQLGGNDSDGFGRGIRKCIIDWYNSKSSGELVKIFMNHRQLYGLSHGDLIKLAHVKFSATDNPERHMIFESMLIRPNRFIEKYKDRTSTMSENVKFLDKVLRLRICENVVEAQQLLSDDDIKLVHVPAHFYNQPIIWETLLPKLSYREIIKIFPTLHVMQLISTDNVLAKKLAAALCNRNLISSGQVHPLELLALKRSYEENVRHKLAVRHDNKRVLKRNLIVNPMFSQKFRFAINHSFQFVPRTGAKIFITLDLRETNTKRFVYGMGRSAMNCMEASVLLALSIVKREKNVRVFTFTEDKTRLKPVSISEKDSFEKAYKYCVENSVKRTFQSLATPIEYAYRDKYKFDVFLVIVDSVARFHRNGTLEMPYFDIYRVNYKHAKYIVLSLAYAKKFLLIDKKGFLEINGLNENVPKLISAFAKNQFS